MTERLQAKEALTFAVAKLNIGAGDMLALKVPRDWPPAKVADLMEKATDYRAATGIEIFVYSDELELTAVKRPEGGGSR